MTGWESCRLGRVIRTHVSFSYRHPHGLICTVYVLGLCCGQAAFSSHYHSSHCSLMMRLHQPAFTQPLRCRRYENGIRRNNAKSLQAKKLRVGWESPTQALYWHPPERTLTHTHTLIHKHMAKCTQSHLVTHLNTQAGQRLGKLTCILNILLQHDFLTSHDLSVVFGKSSTAITVVHTEG